MPLARDVLDEALSGYRQPNDKVSEWLREGALQPLRRGLYLAGAPLRTSPACLPLIANHLYGPSCVSLDFALAWHGLIPEGVAEVTSVTPKPSRRLSNALGRFTYHHLPLPYYTVGQELGQAADGLSFLIASPAKALCDRLVLSRQLAPLSRGAMRQWLLEDLRLDPDQLGLLNLAAIRACLATGYKRRQLGTLLKVIETLQQELATEPSP
ncbi:type IV toxin-antitoxin system AbiEi family antitoxin domain-containing protein [Cyanobium sp. ATX-6F1]|uniref:type IV toxin-antitoxin system AbiEi family antitoxin domain-containing protein n=1 Tax=Cyanobium sp. ATX-6F1 TaxID=3137388 RepID=UPI0039BEB699